MRVDSAMQNDTKEEPWKVDDGLSKNGTIYIVNH